VSYTRRIGALTRHPFDTILERGVATQVSTSATFRLSDDPFPGTGNLAEYREARLLFIEMASAESPDFLCVLV